MPRQGTYRRKSDGAVVHAVQYGVPNSAWYPEWIAEVRNFMTGVDLETRTTGQNEQFLDVVQPVLKDWNVELGIADLLISDPGSGEPVKLGLFDWIVSHGNSLFSYLNVTEFFKLYEPALPDNLSPEEQEFERLANFIYNECMSTMDGELYQALAQNIAARLLEAGYRKATS